MNDDTLVVVHCYSGDQHQVEFALPQYLHHKVPVLILSPEDAPVYINHPGVECRSLGRRAYYGQESLDRQRAHLELLTTYPQKFFLLNDADSMCLSPEIPPYLYARSKDTVWSNVVPERRPHRSPYPKIAFHPPYFLRKDTIVRLLEHADIPAHPITPFIDWYMVAMTCEAGLRYESYPDGKSFPAWRHQGLPGTIERGHDYKCVPTETGKDGGARMERFVREGVVMVHSVKHEPVLRSLVRAHDMYVTETSRISRGPDVHPVSLLVPFREDSSGTRTRVWRWVERFYREYLPEAEIVVGHDDGMPYSKAAAVNDAAARASHYIFVILDSDTLIDPNVIRQCADTITKSRNPVWFIPHSRAFRLTRTASERYLSMDPAADVIRLDRPARVDMEDYLEDAPGFVQIVSRLAFNRVHGYDPRFRGWGGEDSSFVRALTTLYAPPTRTANHVLHLWHERPGAGSPQTRRWDGQDGKAPTYRELAQRYRAATGNREAMRQLVREH